MTRRNVLGATERALLVVGVGLLAYAGASYAYREAYQIYLTWTFVPELPVSWQPSPTIAVAEGMPVANLEIPRLNLSVVVLEGVGDNILEVGAGHVPQTSLPGKSGNVAIAAHRDTFFRPLRNIQRNDVVRVTTTAGVFDYAVEWTRVVKPTDVEVLNPTEKPSLTLITCYPFHYVGSAPDRFIVRGRLISTTT